MRYEKDTVYTATVNAGNSVHRIYFLFSVHHASGKRVSIGEGIHTGPEWKVYHVDTVTEGRLTPSEVHHICPEGTWIMTTPYGCYPTWQFKTKDGHTYEPEISLANDSEGLGGRHYEARIIFANPLQPKIEFTSKKEVEGKMCLQLYDVILFNRKTKQVDFREDIIAETEDEAYLLAVQQFGKYDPKLHKKQANNILAFDEFKEKG